MLEEYRVTFALNAPNHLTLMVKCDRFQQTNLSSLKCQLVTGGRSSFYVQNEINSRLSNGKVCAAYGLSESAGAMTFNLSEKDAVGQLVSCFSMKIVDDDGNQCGTGENGEVCFRANYPFLGYYNNQKATDQVLDAAGFFQTGDIGHFDEDGDLFIVDRKKDLIKYNGFQISPSQIESFLVQCSGIKTACVIGVRDDNNDTELPAAFLVRQENSDIDEKTVFDRVAGEASNFLKCLCKTELITIFHLQNISRITVSCEVAFILLIHCRQHLLANFCEEKFARLQLNSNKLTPHEIMQWKPFSTQTI